MSRVCEAKPSLNMTRKERAATVMTRVTQGPSPSLAFSKANLTLEQIAILESELQNAYTRWASSWIVSDLKKLIPELRENKDDKNTK